MEKVLIIKTLGDFTLRYENQVLSQNDNRSRKIWLLLAYMLGNRNRVITQDNIINLLWGGDEELSNIKSALKTTMHRLRALLSPLSEAYGEEFIIYAGGNYAWNKNINIRLDLDEFDEEVRLAAAAENEEEAIDHYTKLLDLYTGDLFPKLSMENWIVSTAAYYHNIYIDNAQKALELLASHDRSEELIKYARMATKIEPYSEEFACHLMSGLIDTGAKQDAVTVYNDMHKLLINNFGVMPSEKMRELYHEALKVDMVSIIPADTFGDNLKEENSHKGALFCEYDFFKIIYQAQTRFITRSGEIVHIAMFIVGSQNGKALSDRSLNLAMDNLQEIICKTLRKGDVVTRGSKSQFIVMLPQANYENSCMVCARIIRAFYRQYPHSPAEINYVVQALEPNV